MKAQQHRYLKDYVEELYATGEREINVLASCMEAAHALRGMLKACVAGKEMDTAEEALTGRLFMLVRAIEGRDPRTGAELD